MPLGGLFPALLLRPLARRRARRDAHYSRRARTARSTRPRGIEHHIGTFERQIDLARATPGTPPSALDAAAQAAQVMPLISARHDPQAPRDVVRRVLITAYPDSFL